MIEKELRDAGVDQQRRTSGAAMDLLLHWATPEIGVRGSGNLMEARDLMREGVPHLVVANHISNADGPVIKDIFATYRLPDPVFLVGLKLNQQWFTRFMASGVSGIPVWPDTLEPATESDRDKKSQVNARAAQASKMVLEAGHPLVVFPEGTRSRSAQLKEANSKVSRYMLMHPETRVLPLGIWNTEIVFPVDRALPKRGTNAQVAVGKSTPVSLLGAGIDMESTSGQKELMDRTMKLVAGLLPAEYRGVYSNR